MIGREAQALIDIVRHHGVYGLGGDDGCRCAHFSLRNIDIDIHCHKSNGGVDKWHRWGVIRINPRSDDVDMEDRAAIAEELLRLLAEPERDDDDDPYWIVRFCGWKHDYEQRCIYCGNSREELQGYLCNKCLTGHQPYGPEYRIADSYDFRQITVRQPTHTTPASA